MLSQCNKQMKISFPGLVFAQYKSINIISLLLLLLLLLSLLLLLLLLLLSFLLSSFLLLLLLLLLLSIIIISLCETFKKTFGRTFY